MDTKSVISALLALMLAGCAGSKPFVGVGAIHAPSRHARTAEIAKPETPPEALPQEITKAELDAARASNYAPWRNPGDATAQRVEDLEHQVAAIKSAPPDQRVNALEQEVRTLRERPMPERGVDTEAMRRMEDRLRTVENAKPQPVPVDNGLSTRLGHVEKQLGQTESRIAKLGQRVGGLETVVEEKTDLSYFIVDFTKGGKEPAGKWINKFKDRFGDDAEIYKIIGFADDLSGTEAGNDKVSTARAERVAKELKVAGLTVDSKNVIGWGGTKRFGYDTALQRTAVILVKTK